MSATIKSFLYGTACARAYYLELPTVAPLLQDASLSRDRHRELASLTRARLELAAFEYSGSAEKKKQVSDLARRVDFLTKLASGKVVAV